MKKIHIILHILLLIVLSSFVNADDLTTDLVSYWKLDIDSSTQIDSVGSNNGTVTSATYTASGKISGAYNFDGDNDKITISHLIMNPLSVSMWVKRTGTGAEGTMGGAYSEWAIYFNSGNYLAFGKNGVSEVLTTGTITDTDWHNIVITYDQSNCIFYVDGSLEVSRSYTDVMTGTTDFLIGALGSSFFTGTLDEIAIYNKVLNITEITDLYNLGLGCNPVLNPTGCDIVESGTLNLLLANTTATTNYKTIFEESENFYVYLNWTNQDGLPLNQTDGFCNITLFESLNENESTYSDFSLCDSGCDYDSLVDNFSFESGASSEDTILIKVCHTSNIKKDLLINYACDGGNDDIVINKNSFPQCPNTATIIRNMSGNCFAVNEIQITLDNEAKNLGESHTITSFEMDREFAIDTHSSLNDEITFNSATELWDLTISHEYYKHGLKTIHGNCTGNNTLYDISQSTTFTIANAPPQIFIEQVNNSGGFVNLTNEIVLQYYDGSWEWFGAVVDDDLVSFNVSWSNSTSILQENNTIVNVTQLMTPSKMFQDFTQNPFSLNVSAIDSFGNVTTASISFNVTDTFNPVCVGFSNSSVSNNTIYTWGAICSDESLFSLNVSCDNGFEYSQTGIDSSTFHFANSTLITNDTTCSATICDGHTDFSISDMIISDETSHYKRTFDNKISIESDKELDTFNTIKEGDRYSFDIIPTYAESSISFTITSDEFIYIMNQAKYTGWIITGKYWVDFVSDDVQSSKVMRVSDTEVVIEVIFKKEISTTTFKSIGVLNCVEYSQFIAGKIPSGVPTGLGIFDDQTCPLEEDLSFMFGFFMLLGFLVVFWILNIMFIKMPILDMILGVCFITMSFPIGACGVFYTIPFIVFGLFVMVYAFKQ